MMSLHPIWRGTSPILTTIELGVYYRPYWHVAKLSLKLTFLLSVWNRITLFSQSGCCSTSRFHPIPFVFLLFFFLFVFLYTFFLPYVNYFHCIYFQLYVKCVKVSSALEWLRNEKVSPDYIVTRHIFMWNDLWETQWGVFNGNHGQCVCTWPLLSLNSLCKWHLLL